MSCCFGTRGTKCRPPSRRSRRSQLAPVDERGPVREYSLQRISSITETEMFTAREECTSSRHDPAPEEAASSIFPQNIDSDLAILVLLREKMDTMREYILDTKKEFVSCGTAGKIPLFFRPKAPIVARGEVFVEGVNDFEFIASAICCKGRPDWDTDVIEITLIREIPVQISSPDFNHEKLVQVYNSFKGRFGFPGRDFVWNVYIAWSDTDLVQLTYSPTEFPPNYEPNSKFVRAETTLSGYWVRKLAGGCMIHFINQTDIKGRLPDWIVESVVKKSPGKLEQLKTYLISNNP